FVTRLHKTIRIGVAIVGSEIQRDPLVRWSTSQTPAQPVRTQGAWTEAVTIATPVATNRCPLQSRYSASIRPNNDGLNHRREGSVNILARSNPSVALRRIDVARDKSTTTNARAALRLTPGGTNV